MATVVGILVALVVAAFVLLVASVASTERDERSNHSPWRSFRRGLSARRNPEPDQVAAAQAAQADPVDLSLADFLRQAADDGEPYLGVEDLGQSLVRARDKAARALPLRRHG